MSSKRPRHGAGQVPEPKRTRFLLVAVFVCLAAGPVHAFTWPWDAGGPWPSSSKTPVQPLAHPVLAGEMLATDVRPVADARPVEFAVYGDQRALADGEWQDLVARIEERHRRDPLAFIIDTGDIVQDGRHTDQFSMLAQIVSPLRDLPYLVAVGNHEVRNNESVDARRNTARCLALTEDSLRPERLYYSKQVGTVRFLFLDTNDLAYGPTPGLAVPAESAGQGREDLTPVEATGSSMSAGRDEAGRSGAAAADPVAAQIRWLDEELSRTRPEETVIVAMHHPFLQSSKKHREQAIALWNRAYEGHTLPERFLDAGVDLVLVGHTHTYERFRVRRGGRHFDLVNVSGRPRTSLFWVGDGARRAKDIRGDEMEWLAKNGWEGLDSLTIEQGAVMAKDERNQYAILAVQPDGRIALEVTLVDGAEETVFERVELR